MYRRSADQPDVSSFTSGSQLQPASAQSRAITASAARARPVSKRKQSSIIGCCDPRGERELYLSPSARLRRPARDDGAAVAARACGSTRRSPRLLPQHSRSRLKRWIDEGQVTVDGARVEPRIASTAARRSLFARRKSPATRRTRHEDITLAVVHEDAAIIVVDKPAGLVVHPGNGNPDGTLLNALLHHAPELAQVARAGIVHRLDKDTSGLLVVARTPEAQTALVRALAARTVKREYLALVARRPGADGHGRCADRPASGAAHDDGRRRRRQGGAHARRAHRALRRARHSSAARWTPGARTRSACTCAAIKHPLVGDPTYGAGRAAVGIPAFPRQALHAWRLGLVHPVSGKAMAFEAPAPADFAALLDILRANHG